MVRLEATNGTRKLVGPKRLNQLHEPEDERRRPRSLHRLSSNKGWKRNPDLYESDLGDVDSSVVFEESYADSGVARE